MARRRASGLPEGSGLVIAGDLIYWAIVLLLVAIVAALFGFGGLAGTAMEGARLLFWVAILALIIVAVTSIVQRRG